MISIGLKRYILNEKLRNFSFRNLFFIFQFIILSLGMSQETDPVKIFDPSKHRDVQPRWPIIINNILESGSPLDTILAADTVHWINEGFRVQIMTTKSIQKADSLSLKLNSELIDSVYVIYEAPNYKVRVGDFVTRSEADLLREAMKKKGYSSAWVISTKITPQRTGMFIRSRD